MNTPRQLLLLVLLATPPMLPAADDMTASVDTSAWKCKYCPFEEGASNYVDIGFGYVSEDSYKFGEYSGLQNKGGFFIGNAGSSYQSDTAHYWDIEVSDLGLDSRALTVEGGQQGFYSLTLQYRELAHFISDSARTPYLGVGSGSLTLPTGWVDGGSTATMTTLNSSLNDVELETKRRQGGIAVLLIPASRWETRINFREEIREGEQRIAGSFYFNSAELVKPVEYTTDLIEASASYSDDTWQARLAYNGSLFTNDNAALAWQNPYLPIVAGADSGQLALPPDNEFHQIIASVSGRFGETTHANASIATGRMTQNERLLDATLNPNIAVPTASAFDGRVDTSNASINVTSDLSKDLRLSAAWRSSERDNQSTQAVYDWVTTDANVATPRINQPYSFTDTGYKLGAAYRVMPGIKASLGYENNTYERTYQEVEKSDETTVWGKIKAHAFRMVDVALKLAHAERDISGYDAIPGLDTPENPLLRKYNMADRERDNLGFRADVAVTPSINIGLGYDHAEDDYTDSEIGLTSSTDTTVSFDVTGVLTERLSGHAFLVQEQIESTLAGSQGPGSSANWLGDSSDTVNTMGLGINYIVIDNKLDVGAEYSLSESQGDISIDTLGIVSTLPELSTELSSLKVYGKYRMSDTMTLKGTYWYESYDSEDWMLDGVTVDTIGNVVSLGQASPDYSVNVIMVSLQYRF